MICAILTLLCVVAAGFAVLPWFVMRIMAIARSDGHLDVPVDIVDSERSPLQECPRCGHQCGICFKGAPVEPVEMRHCNECGWIGPPVSND